MSDEAKAGAKKAKGKSSINVLRDRRGGMTDELKAYFKEQQRVRKALVEALRGGPRTVPELAAAVRLETPAAMWHVAAMRRYGRVVDGPARDGYPSYALKEVVR
jgi:hypothetical protein